MSATHQFTLTHARLLGDCKVNRVGDNWAINIRMVDDSVERFETVEEVDTNTGEVKKVKKEIKPWQMIEGTLWFPAKNNEAPTVAALLTQGKSVSVFMSDLSPASYETKEKTTVLYMKGRIEKLSLGESTKEYYMNKYRDEIIAQYKEAQANPPRATKVK